MSNCTWHDLLTSYDGQAIEYDSIGNPTAYRGWGMTWQGRQLTKAVKDKTVTFTYDGIFGFIVDKAGEHADGIVGTVSNIVEKLFGRKR